jgi:crossover junction endodeoxyribonuclease RuvC
MKILGIDPGTARMGYSIVNIKNKKGDYKVIEADVLTTPAEQDMPKRLQSLHAGLHRILKQHEPDIMVIEKLFFNSNAKTAMTVGQARGVALLAGAEWDLSIFEYTAIEAKFVLTGFGRADKKAMQEAVRKLLGNEKIVKSDDANDAIAMAICYIKKNYVKA